MCYLYHDLTATEQTARAGDTGVSFQFLDNNSCLFEQTIITSLHHLAGNAELNVTGTYPMAIEAIWLFCIYFLEQMEVKPP